MFIVFEGIDGSGKTTQMELLHRVLSKAGVNVLSVREPGGTPLGEQLRRVLHDGRNAGMTPACEMLLYAAARAQLVETVIEPALKAGRMVLCDRFVPSSVAYQAHGRGQNTTFEMFTYFVNDTAVRYTCPTAVIYLDIPVSEAMKRRHGSTAMNHLDKKSRVFYQRVKDGYTAVATNPEWGYGPDVWRVVDAYGEPDEVHGRVLATVEQLFIDKFNLPSGTRPLRRPWLDELGARLVGGNYEG